MKVVSRRALLTGFVLGLGLPVMGCGEPLKSGTEGSGPAGPPPANQTEWKKQEEERLKALKAASKTKKPTK
jgi:hypothetical protein